MTREEVLSINRRSITRKEFPTPEHEPTQHNKSPSPPHPAMTRKTLHNLGAAPKSRLMGSEQWIRNEPKGRGRRSEVIRSSIGSVSEHWLVEEAERRRLAELRGQERLSYPNRQEPPPIEDGINVDILAPPQGYQLSQLSRSWQGSREQTPSRASPSRSVGGWEGSREQESPQRSQFSYSQKPLNMSTFRAPPVPVRVTEIEKPEDSDKPRRPIPEDIKQSLIDRVNAQRAPNSPHQGQSSPVYAHPRVTVSSPSYPYVQSYPSSHHISSQQSSLEHKPQQYPRGSPDKSYPNYSGVPSASYPDQPSYQFGYAGQQQTFPQSHTSHELCSNTNSPPPITHSPRHSSRPTQSPPKPPHSPGGPYGSAQPNWVQVRGNSSYPAGYHDQPPSSSGSMQSTDRAPPVPPKPPRLLSSSSEESSEQVVSVSASKRCSHCEMPLAKCSLLLIYLPEEFPFALWHL
ncbi:hypothetical protein LSH36_376g04010 [Paralvinella palmiformis]|uniref:Uncharacterized protein n=1 Tax=Paralvinella palmiformis TaxID=53620 RepID=A0AAD9JDE5_9ANNE|nr:hypothetical protein LSH36_376g04010 [Paralvinella palmiformis]